MAQKGEEVRWNYVAGGEQVFVFGFPRGTFLVVFFPFSSCRSFEEQPVDFRVRMGGRGERGHSREGGGRWEILVDDVGLRGDDVASSGCDFLPAGRSFYSRVCGPRNISCSFSSCLRKGFWR